MRRCCHSARCSNMSEPKLKPAPSAPSIDQSSTVLAQHGAAWRCVRSSERSQGLAAAPYPFRPVHISTLYRPHTRPCASDFSRPYQTIRSCFGLRGPTVACGHLRPFFSPAASPEVPAASARSAVLPPTLAQLAAGPCRLAASRGRIRGCRRPAPSCCRRPSPRAAQAAKCAAPRSPADMRRSVA